MISYSYRGGNYHLYFNLAALLDFKEKYQDQNLVELISQGTGIALIMSKPVAPILPEDLTRVDIEPRVTTTIFLAYLKNRKFNTACKRFLELVKTVPFHET